MDKANLNADNHMQSDESYEPPSPSWYNPPYSLLPIIQISRPSSQHLGAAVPDAKPGRLRSECSSAHEQPGQDEETTGQDGKARGNKYEHGDDKEDGRSNMGARLPSSKVSIYITIDYVCAFTDAP